MTDHLAILRRNSLLATLPDEVLSELAVRAPEREFAAGTVIFRDGDPGLCMYVIAEGEVEIIKGLGRDQILLARLHAGEFFGEMALIEDSPRAAGARAATPLTLIEVAKGDALAAMKRHPDLLFETVRVLSSRLRQTDLAHISELQRKNQELEQANRRLQESYQATLVTLSHALDLRDQSTEGHSHRVTAYSLLIGEALDLDAEQLKTVRLGALLHDIGKIGVSDTILRKPGKLTTEEWIEMRNHPTWGRQVIKGIAFLQEAAEIVYAHHERIDGSGYPRGLRGSEIPLGARIFAIADTFDAMTMQRPYNVVVSPAAALDEIKSGAGAIFDPDVVTAFARVFPQVLEVMRESYED